MITPASVTHTVFYTNTLSWLVVYKCVDGSESEYLDTARYLVESRTL